MRQEIFEKMISGDKLSPKEKLEAVKGLVSAKTESILLQRMALAIATKKDKVSFVINNYHYSENIDDIETFLGVMDCKNIKTRCSSFDNETTLKIQFNLN